MKTIVLLVAVSSLQLFASSNSAVQYLKADDRRCQGAFLKSKGNSVLATVAHCLENFTTGGIRLTDGTRSKKVYVPDEARKNAYKVNGDYTVDSIYDFALVVFPEDSSRTVAPRNFSIPNGGERAVVGTFRSNVRSTSSVTLEKPTTTTQLISNAYSGARPGDSGAALFDKKGMYLGALRGCARGRCGFLPAHSLAAHGVFKKVDREAPELFAKPKPKPTPRTAKKTPTPRTTRKSSTAPRSTVRSTPRSTTRSTPRKAASSKPVAKGAWSFWKCSADCEVVFRSVRRTKKSVSNIEALAKGASRAEAETNARGELRKLCSFCNGCTSYRIVSAPSCKPL